MSFDVPYSDDFILRLSDELGEDPETIIKTLWLQNKIRRDGIDATRFMAKSSKKMEAQADTVTKQKITKELKKRFE